MRRATYSFLLICFVASPLWAQKRPITVTDLFAFQRVADPQISPDGKWVAYQVGAVDLAANKSTTNLWLAATDGKSPPRRLTSSTKADRHPRWSPDGKKILFESTRSGESQLWIIDLSGGEAKQLTTISTGASSGTWSPDGKNIAFVSAVFPEFSEKPFAESDKLNKAKLDDAEKSPVKAKTFTRLFYRHWDEYVDDKRQHLFVMPADGGEPKDVTPGDRDASPTSSTFSAGDDFTFTPDSKHLVFTAVPDRDESWSTNYDLCRVSITNSSTKWETLTKDNPAADGAPRFSPDGKKLAFRAQKRAGYEADKWDILIADANADGTLKSKATSLLSKQDVSPDEWTWKDDATIYFVGDENGIKPIKKVSLANLEVTSWAGGNTDVGQGIRGSIGVGKNGALVYTSIRMDAPAEVFTEHADSSGPILVTNISGANTALLNQLDLARPESVQIQVEGDVRMQMWVLKPPGFEPKKKWPVAYLVHGGPQGAWEDGWSYRWNPQTWAAQGYVVVMPNPRGSTGFGQKFVDEISGDWGGKCYRDLVAGLDYVEKLPYVDKDRIGSAGGSFGGYMMNWFAVNDVAPRFKCLITHCSVWNFESMWGTTDELWFDEYEHGGLPWDKPSEYAKFSPHKKAGNLGKYKTAMLIVHNDLDFRCPIGQGHELFSALQRQKVPSRFVNFPDEGHWVLKPKNSERWHKEVFDWLKKYCPPGGK
jgi:dipeptidyl aminopeptidase/acylaminoacyl peptidase